MTIIDLIILFIIGYYAWRGFQTGFIGGLLNLAATLLAFYAALNFYPGLGAFLSSQFNASETLSRISAFLILLIGLDIVFSYLFNFFKTLVMKQVLASFLAPLYLADKVLGIVPSVLISAVLVSTVLLIPLNQPFNQGLKTAVQESFWNKAFMPIFYQVLPQTQKLLQNLPVQNLTNLLITNRPFIQVPGQNQVIEGRDSIKLKPTTQTTFNINREDEDKMLELVNKERRERGLKELKVDFKAVEVARKHSLDMIVRAYFSHYDPDGRSPADRMDTGGVDYRIAGENLACAPNVNAAHQGLMNSPGHRENILRPEFGRVGIGVYDGGECGRMYTQEFAD